jgi:hypothetical protein
MDDTLENKVCRACGKLKHITSFDISNTPDGRTARCKICIKHGNLIPKHLKNTGPKIERDKYVDNRDTSYSMGRVTKETYKQMYEFLQQIGYDITKSIHQQFCDKYGLKTKRRYERNENKYSIEDLDLF